MTNNPSPAQIDDTMWWLWEQLQALEPKHSALGGIYANKSGYHNSRTNNENHWPSDYSIRDAIDKKGPAGKGSAIDWTFRDAQAGNYATINKYFNRAYAAAKGKDPRMDGWREIFGQANVDSHVEGWDIRYHKTATSDSSHLWHIHFSEVRAYISSQANKECLLSVLKGESLAAYTARGGKFASAVVVTTPGKGLKLGDRTLTKGAKGDDVKEAQTDLNTHGASPKVTVDGDFGDNTFKAVEQFQTKSKLHVDGQIGPDTTKALKAAVVKPAPPKPPAIPQLRVDGVLGTNTIRRWQQVMGTPVDGVISVPSDLTKAVQRFLNKKGYSLDVDGKGLVQDGKQYMTVKVLQRYLGKTQDGKLSNPSDCIKAVQEHLNAGKF